MKNYIKFLPVIFISVVLFNSCYYDSEEELYKFSKTGCDTTNVTYTLTIAPIIQSSCVGCHSGASPSGNLSLQNYNEIVSAVNSKSLYTRITSTSNPMPSAGLMDECNIKKIKIWIDSSMPNN